MVAALEIAIVEYIVESLLMSSKLLLVDDDDFVRLVTGESLVQLGYAVDMAQDGQEAWEKIMSDPYGYDLVLLDRNMPRLDGIALLKRIKADARLTDLPIVMLTGADRPEEIADGLAAGAYYYLTKPASQEVLRSVIKNTLDDSLKKRELRELLGHQRNSLGLMRRAEFEYQTLQEAKDLALLLADASMNPPRTVNGYSELLINAVEHGNLGITYAEKGQLLNEGRWADEVESRLRQPHYSKLQVSVVVEKTAEACVVTITDQGSGFDWQSYIGFSTERAFDLHGRGIAMSKAMSFDSLEYRGTGNSVAATVLLPAMGGS